MQASERFRKNLRRAMKAERITATCLAERLNTSQPYLSRVLSGETRPGLDKCEAIARAVGLPLSALLDSPEIFAESVLTKLPD